jgi:hypothetical protein
MAELTVEVVEIAEGADEEEVIADLSERPLDPDRAGRLAARRRNGERDRRARLETTSPSTSSPRTAAFIRS